jgi:hypothetical protein
MRKRFEIVAVMSMLAAGAWSASAAVIPFDPDGGGPDGTVQLGSMDFTQGSSLGENVLVGQEWTLYYQSSLGSLLDGSASVIVGTGLNVNYEITVVAAVDVVTTFFDGNNIQFQRAVTPGVNFFRLYYDTSLNADPLAGTGFNDGTLILDSSARTDLVGFFNFTSGGPAVLDQFSADDWGGTLTRVGIGAFSTSAEVTSFDASFFPGLGDELLDLVFANSSQILPFRETDPSYQFWDGSGFVPSDVGAVNGVDGPDVIVQADANGSFEPVPEPASERVRCLGFIPVRLKTRAGARRLPFFIFKGWIS